MATFLGLLPESCQTSKILFAWLQASLEQPAVWSTKLAYVSEASLTCAHINLKVLNS